MTMDATQTRGAPTETVVPFVDLSFATLAVRDRVLERWQTLLAGGGFVNGPDVEAFEIDFAHYCRTTGAVGVASGLDALRLAVLAFGLEPGDEAIVPANTFIATVEALVQAGVNPVFVDSSDSDHNIDVDAAAAAIGERTRLLVPVHLYGQLSDMVAIRELAEQRSLLVLEDACQAHGASRDGVTPGAASDAAAFSFYPGKNLGAFGDAGALATNRDDVAATVRSLREHGQSAKYIHEALGYTARLDTLQAIVLQEKLRHLDRWNAERVAAAAYYDELLRPVGDLRLPPVPAGSAPVWHLYVVRTEDPVRLASYLRDRGISTGFHYPQPPHLSPALAHLGLKPGSFPNAEAQAREAISLPIFPGITEAQLAAVVEGIQAFFASGG